MLAGTEGTILLVDDQPEQIDIIKAALDQHFVVKVAIRGNHVLPICLAGGIDLILLDIMMPDMDGFEVCRRLKEHPATTNTPVIFLTSRDGQEDEVIGLELGAVDFIRKPSTPAIVLLRCRNMIAHQYAREDLRRKNAELQKTMQIREDVERIARHDLKGPLSSILGVPEMLLEHDNLTEAQKTLLRMIERSGYTLLEMINRSLDLFKMENGNYLLQAERINLLEILERVMQDLGRYSAPRGIKVLISSENMLDHLQAFCVIGEKMLCYPLFYNLVLNAVEASLDNTNVNVQLAISQQFGTIRITNDGEVHTTIRERFFDKYVTFGKIEGTGLGTYSAWLAVKTQGGGIDLDTSQPGKTSVIVTLPACGQKRQGDGHE